MAKKTTRRVIKEMKKEYYILREEFKNTRAKVDQLIDNSASQDEIKTAIFIETQLWEKFNALGRELSGRW